MRQRQAGITLTEVLLVFAIGVSMVMLSVQQYQTYRLSADAAAIKYNVDLLAQAATFYYLANCNLNSAPSTYALRPNLSASTVTVNISTTLAGSSYLTNTLPMNPLVDNGTTPNQYAGYSLQFSKLTSTVETGTIVQWQAKVGVKLKKVKYATYLKNLTNATCVTTKSGSSLRACDAPGTPSDSNAYLAFDFLPSIGTTPETQSGFWQAGANLLEFKQMYTTYPKSYLMGSDGKTPSSTQYFYCGS